MFFTGLRIRKLENVYGIGRKIFTRMFIIVAIFHELRVKIAQKMKAYS